MNYAKSGTAIVAAMGLATAACSPVAPPWAEQEADGGTSSESASVSDRELEAARKLSVVAGAGSSIAGTPFEQAVICAKATGFLTGKLNETGRVSAKQKVAMDQIATRYRSEALRAGTSQNMAPEDVEAMFAIETTDRDEQAELMRLALTCLRQSLKV